jgi:cytochrome c biogenesis protein CcmG/thiol:disulfide interchange protein DsbE
VKRLLYVLPFLAFAALAVLFYSGLKGTPPDQLPSAMIGKPVPPIVLAGLDGDAKGFSPADLASGRVTVVNVWASWCAPCRLEAPALARLSRRKDIALYGFVYKDKPAAARAFLAEFGNPFARLGLDANGSTAIEWGVYGVPETFVIDGHGIIRERYAGELTETVLSTVIEPAIARAGL